MNKRISNVLRATLVFALCNFIYQFLQTTPEYSVAFERTYFQFIAAVLYEMIWVDK